MKSRKGNPTIQELLNELPATVNNHKLYIVKDELGWSVSYRSKFSPMVVMEAVWRYHLQDALIIMRNWLIKKNFIKRK